jgi:hypothetical protein
MRLNIESKSFLVLFFKKELLPSFCTATTWHSRALSRKYLGNRRVATHAS